MPPTIVSRPRLLLLLGVLVLALVAGVLLVTRDSTADDAGDGGDGGDVAPTLPSIDPAWTSEPPTARSLASLAPVMSSPEVAVVASSEGLSGVDTATGETRWEAPLGIVCAASDPAADGTVALTVRAAGAYDCRRLVLLDTATGTVRWEARTPAGQDYARVVITRRSVLFHADCPGWRRFDRATGRELGRPQIGGYCIGAGLSPEVLAAPILRGVNPVGVELRDADSGRRTATVRGYGGDRTLDVRDVVSTDPLVLDVTRQGHRLLRVVDEQGRPGRYLGYQQDTNPNGVHTLLGIADGVMVVRYTYLNVATYGIDLATGDVLWTLAQEDSGRFLGLQGDDVLTTRRYGDAVVLTRAPVRDLQDAEVLGVLRAATTDGAGAGMLATLSGGPNIGLVGDRVVVATEDATTAYPVPADGVVLDDPGTQAALEALTAEAAVPPAAADDGYTEDDFRPGDSRGCDDVSTRVFTLLGWGAAARLPRSATCGWGHVSTAGTDAYWTSRVEVGVTTAAPAQVYVGDEVEVQPAVEVAVAQLEEARTRGSVRVPGLGDEAWIRQSRFLGDREVQVWVRDRNRVWSFRVRAEVDRYPDAPVPAPSADAVEAAVHRLLTDVLTPDGLVVPDRLPGAAKLR